MGKSEQFFSSKQQAEILTAIKQAELATSGEIRLFIEDVCKEENVLDRAAYIFEELAIHKTAHRNGVLFYLAVNDRKFAILGDAGINSVVPDDFWNAIKETMLNNFKQNNFTEGLSKGIAMAGEALKQYFPHEDDDVNELPDEIVFGK
jgi:uncharacterized membrane protein